MLPQLFARMRSFYNLPCKDENSLCYAIASQFMKHKANRGQSTYRKMLCVYKRYLKYPVMAEDLRELQQKWRYIINIYTCDDDSGYKRRCIFHTLPIPGLKPIEIFYYNGRFYLIRNFNGFMRGNSKGWRKQFHCRRCLLRFSNDNHRLEHEEICAEPVVFGLYNENGILIPSSLPLSLKPTSNARKRIKYLSETKDASTMTEFMMFEKIEPSLTYFTLCNGMFDGLEKAKQCEQCSYSVQQSNKWH